MFYHTTPLLPRCMAAAHDHGPHNTPICAARVPTDSWLEAHGAAGCAASLRLAQRLLAQVCIQRVFSSVRAFVEVIFCRIFVFIACFWDNRNARLRLLHQVQGGAPLLRRRVRPRAPAAPRGR